MRRILSPNGDAALMLMLMLAPLAMLLLRPVPKFVAEGLSLCWLDFLASTEGDEDGKKSESPPKHIEYSVAMAKDPALLAESPMAAWARAADLRRAWIVVQDMALLELPWEQADPHLDRSQSPLSDPLGVQVGGSTRLSPPFPDARLLPPPVFPSPKKLSDEPLSGFTLPCWSWEYSSSLYILALFNCWSQPSSAHRLLGKVLSLSSKSVFSHGLSTTRSISGHLLPVCVEVTSASFPLLGTEAMWMRCRLFSSKRFGGFEQSQSISTHFETNITISVCSAGDILNVMPSLYLQAINNEFVACVQLQPWLKDRTADNGESKFITVRPLPIAGCQSELTKVGQTPVLAEHEETTCCASQQIF